ncbi:hypothetical protein M9Y10_019661 [Tritrichomonas musculus]|uniref:HECT-type E3 ubiquitin transferase n=1 Tax=Tritrichomonas musculus TaxID=1915356 RepID=A0ABR2HHX6_9EUKA
MKNNKTLLLPSSIIFNNSNLLDRIHQSVIDLENNQSPKEIYDLTIHSISYFNTNIDSQIKDEIISLLSSCFSHYQNPPNDIIDDIFNHSRDNSYRLILTASICSTISHSKKLLTLPNFRSFVRNVFKQIVIQFKNGNNNQNFIIFDHKIPPKYQANFIINMLFVTDLTEKSVSLFSPYIFSQKKISHTKLNQFIAKIADLGLISKLPETILTDKKFFVMFSMDNLSALILKMSDETFRKILPLIEETFSETKELSKDLVTAILYKCIKLNINFKLIDNLVNSLTVAHMKPAVWKYLANLNVILSDHLASQIKTFPNPAAALKIMPDMEKIPPDVFAQGLVANQDFDVYKRSLITELVFYHPNEVYSNLQFWTHLKIVISEYKERCPPEFINNLAEIFKNFNDSQKFNEIFTEMIFVNFPSTNNGNYFLDDFSSKFDFEYKNIYNRNAVSLIQRIISHKLIPLPSFWKLISIYRLLEVLKTNNSNPILLYGYEFSSMREYTNRVTKSTILPQTDPNSENLLIEFIKRNDYDYLINMNEESLSLIVNAFIFTRNKEKTEISGLTKENILPFIAISINYINKSNGNLLFLTDEMLETILEGCNLLSNNESQLLNTSINSILTNLNYFVNASAFPIKTSFQMLEILIDLFIKNAYMADKTIFLSTIFKLSCQNPINQQMTDLLDKYGNELFKYIIKSIHKIPEFDKLKNFNLNLKSFNSSSIIDLAVKIIQKITNNLLVINTICFIERFCKNVPKMEISDPKNIVRVLNESVKNKKWDDVLVVGQFMKNNNFEKQLQPFLDKAIPFKTKEILFNYIPLDLKIIDELISEILEDPQPETHFLNFEFLFKEMMKDKSIAMDYINILLEKISSKVELKPDLILQLYDDEYRLYGDCFINALRRVFSFHSTFKIFVRKAEFVTISKPISKIGQFLVSKLFKEVEVKKGNYQVFFVLKNVASSFPFLFATNPQAIFDSVLPLLDNFILYFTTKEDEENINKLKAALSALSFLYSTLYSVDVLDAFVPWLFENIMNFTDSQILSFSFILSSLFSSKNIQEIMLGIAMKFNFIEKVSKLLKKSIPDEIIYQYKNNFYNILFNYYTILNDLSFNVKLIYVDEIQNVENPFTVAFDHFSTILPSELNPLNLPKPPNNISDFLMNINEIKIFWITFDHSLIRTERPTFDQVNHFISHFKKFEPNIPDVLHMKNVPDLYSGNVKMVRYLVHKPNWIYQWIARYSHFSVLPEHIEKLLVIKSEMEILREQSKIRDKNDEINQYYSNISVDDYFLSEYCQNELFDILFKDIISHHHIFKISICSFVNVVIHNNVALLSIIDLINRFIIGIKSDIDSIKPIKKLVDVLISVSSQESFRNNFIEICANNFIEVILSPDCRNDFNLLLKVSQLFHLYNNEQLPIRLTHLVGFMLILNQQRIIPAALDLCVKIGESNLNNIKKAIENAFEKEFKKNNPSYVIIDCFLEKVPTIIHDKLKTLPLLLDKIVTNYKKNSKKDENTINLICVIFNILAPNRLKNLTISVDEIDFSLSLTGNSVEPLSSNQQQSLVRPVSEKLLETNENFWSLYEKYRTVINDILVNDENKLSQLKFLFDYPELLSFQTRFNYFREKMKNRINTKYLLSLNVDRSNILVSSFEKLNGRTNDEWLRKLSITFNGEKGQDAGGLTNEWFTLIAQELFNTNNALFKSSENKSYQPNPSSNINSEHIDYFKFSGKFIARALIQGQCVNAHLMRSFCRQILGVQLKLRDLEDFDEELFKSLQMILNIDVDPLDLNFTIDVSEYGVNKTILLKEGGDEISVTNENKAEYVSLYANYHLRKSIIQQINAFCEGFYSLISHEDISIFSPSELDLLICGIPEINIDDFRRNTVFRYPYNEKHPVIVRFFDVISKWNNENLAKFLLFLTGSSQVPVRGFKDYADRDKPITISYGGDKTRLCVAHTCFNTLDLPEYEDEFEMNEKLLLSIQECEFGLV